MYKIKHKKSIFDKSFKEFIETSDRGKSDLTIEQKKKCFSTLIYARILLPDKKGFEMIIYEIFFIL